MKLYSYILRFDDGAAPNPFGGVCTLNICKPTIRRKAQVGDWVIGTGSKNTRLKDGKTYNFSDSLVYAMKISQVMKMEDYEQYCKQKLRIKLPDWYGSNFERKVGDCIYIFSNKDIKPNVTVREAIHDESSIEHDLGGVNCLLSNHFFYFGEEARPLPPELEELIHTTQGHKNIEDKNLIAQFEKWISKFEKNKIYAQPQLKFEFDKADAEYKAQCATRDLKDDKDDEVGGFC
jgi:hypothetical protein